MSRPSSELAHLFRALKAPAAARALPKLADRARHEEWSFEQFAAALLKTEVDSRDSHGGQGRIKAARFPARKTLEEFDFSFQTSIRRDQVLHLRQLDFLAGRENLVLLGPPGTGKVIWRRDRDPRLSRRRPTRWPPRRRAHPRAVDPAADRRRGRLHPVDPQAANLIFMLVSRRYERASGRQNRRNSLTDHPRRPRASPQTASSRLKLS